jgi:putative cardiolipin synthase
MHNKSFTVDNSVTVIGGRNIAAEYFAGREDVNFGDLDTLAIGPIVRDVSAQFDAYWNDEYAVPVSQFVKPLKDPAARLETVRVRSEQSLAEVRSTRYADALSTSIEDLIGRGGDEFVWVPCELVFDTPEKSRRAPLEGDYDIVNPVRRAIEGAEHEVIIASPYLVPSKDTVAAAGALSKQGVKVMAITNSLASNNHAIVHSGYAPTRRALLDAGVEIYEVRPDAHVAGTEHSGVEHSDGTLHTKAFIVDREVLFLGSFNFDPRSRNINTELGVMIESAELASEVSDRTHAPLAEAAYRVDVDERNRLRWTTYEEGREVVYDKEPGTSWWLRTKVNLMKLLPIRGQL